MWFAAIAAAVANVVVVVAFAVAAFKSATQWLRCELNSRLYKRIHDTGMWRPMCVYYILYCSSSSKWAHRNASPRARMCWWLYFHHHEPKHTQRSSKAATATAATAKTAHKLARWHSEMRVYGCACKFECLVLRLCLFFLLFYFIYFPCWL